MARKDRPEPKYLPVGEAARMLGVCDRQIYKLLRAGLIEAINISASGRVVPQSIRVSRSSIETFKQSRVIDPEAHLE
jgi:excisionase family DNA binding protein